MASNHKLTALIKGRAVTAIDPQGTTAAVRFDDGSVMTVQLAAGAPAPTLLAARASAAAAGTAPVRAVRQQGTTLRLELEGGGTLTFQTAEPTASVLVRDRAQRFEYAD